VEAPKHWRADAEKLVAATSLAYLGVYSCAQTGGYRIVEFAKGHHDTFKIHGKHDHKDEEEWETSAKLTMDNTIAGQNGHAILVDFSQIGGTANTVGTAIGAGIQWADGNLWLRTFVPPRGQANDGYHRTAYIRDARLTPDAANAKNAASFASGVLKHEAPSFLSLPSLDIDQLAPLNIKVIRLSTSFGSHELVFEPSSKCIFVSQMANSVLVRLPLGRDGLVIDEYDSWVIGPVNESGMGMSGLHNISLSKRSPGCLWLSMQTTNQVLLVNGMNMQVMRALQVPTLLADGQKGFVNIGGPHCIRECPKTGDLWVCLKGLIGCHPTVDRDDPKEEDARLRDAKKRACCSPEMLTSNMEKMAKRGYDAPLPKGFAVWRVAPVAYKPLAENAAKGGSLYSSLKSPSMSVADGSGNHWVAQDNAPSVLRIDAVTGKCEQLPLPFLDESPVSERVGGPSIVAAPDGALWLALIACHSCLVRIDPATRQRTLYQIGSPKWACRLSLIHLAFSFEDGGKTPNRLFAISSDLVRDDAINMLVVLEMSSDWSRILARRFVPISAQDSSCHRIVYVGEGIPKELHSVVISQLATPQLIQINVANLVNFTRLEPRKARGVTDDMNVIKFEVVEEKPTRALK